MIKFNKTIKLFCLIFIFLIIWQQNVFWYTQNKDWEIHSIMDMNNMIKMKSTMSYPSWFLDWEIYTNYQAYLNWNNDVDYWNVPLWVWRAYWTKWIDDSNVDCSKDAIAKNTSVLQNRKCFIRHAWMFTKVDVSWYTTAFPSVNNLFQVRIDDNIQNFAWENQEFEWVFEFWLAWFWATYWKSSWLAWWWEVSQAEWNKENSQWAAIQAYLLDENWNELNDIWLDIYAEWLNWELVNVTQIMWKEWEWRRKFVSSTNPLLFRWKCINPSTDWSDVWWRDAYNNNDCKPFNMIFWLTPKLIIKKEDWSQSKMKWTINDKNNKRTYTQIWFRIVPVVKNEKWEIFEPSYLPNDSMWKASLSNVRRSNAWWVWYEEKEKGKFVSAWNMYDLLDESWRKVWQVWEMSNWLSFLTTSSLHHENDWIYKKWMNINQFLSVINKNWDNITWKDSVLSRATSEWLNYNWWFITHQMRKSVPTMTQLQRYDDESMKFIMWSSLWCLVWDQDSWCNWKSVSTKDFQVRNFLLRWRLNKWDSDLYVITLDKDNSYSLQSTQNARTWIWFASMLDERKIRIKEIHNKFSNWWYSSFKEYTWELIKEFDKWRMDWVTSAYSWLEWSSWRINIPWKWPQVIVAKESDLNYWWKMQYIWSEEEMNSFNSSIDNSDHNWWSNENKEIVKLSSPINIRSWIWNWEDNLEISYVDKNYSWNQNKFEYSIDKEWSVEENFNSQKSSIALKWFRHWQWEMWTIWRFHWYKKSWIWIYKIPVKDLLVRNWDREKFLECEWEWENEKCKLKSEYYFNYFISFSAWNNAIWYTMSSDFFVWDCKWEDCDPKDNTPIDLNIKLDNLCVFRKNAAEVDPKNAYYKLLNADSKCQDINVEHWFSATQNEGTDDHNYNWTNVKTKDDTLVKNPIEPLQAGQKAKLEINDTNVCDIAFVGKVTASNLNLLHKEIKDLKIKLSNAPQNVELLTAADININDKSVKFQSKKLSEELDPSNPILNSLNLLQWQDMEASNKIFRENGWIVSRKEAYWNIRLQACDWTVYTASWDSDEKLLYLDQLAKSKNGWVCQYSFEYAFRPISTSCLPMDPQEYGKAITESKEVSIWLTDPAAPVTITKAEVAEWEDSETNPEKFARVLDYEPSRADITKNPKYAGVMPFQKMNITNWWFKVDWLELCTTKPDENSMLPGATTESCITATPVGKKVVFAWLGMNTEKTPSLRIRLYPNGQCVDYLKNGWQPGNGWIQSTWLSTDANKKAADIGWSCWKTMVECDIVDEVTGERLCKVPVKVCLRNEDKNKRDLYRAHIDKMMGNSRIVWTSWVLSNLNILHNQMNLWVPTYGTLKFGEEEKCSDEIILEKEAAICGAKVKVSYKWKAYFNEVWDAGWIWTSEDTSIEWNWDTIECTPPPEKCEEKFGVEFCDPTNGNETPPRIPGGWSNWNNPNPDPNPNEPEDPDNGNQVPPRVVNTVPTDTQCIHRGWTQEITRYFKNTNNYPIKNARIVYEIDKSSYVYGANDFVKRPDGKYEKTFLNVFSESTTPTSSIVIGVKDWVPSWTKIVLKETATFEMMDWSTQTIVNDREFTYWQGKPGEVCQPDSLKDFITLELPKKPIGEEPEDPDNGTQTPPRTPENPNIPFNEVPSKDVPHDGGKIKNCGLHDGKAPNVNWGTYCTQDPGKDNNGNSMKEIWDVCAIYNPTAKAWLNGTSQDAQKTDWEASLDNTLPVVRVIKANYYRVEADPIALANTSRRLHWVWNAWAEFNLSKPGWRWWSNTYQTSSEDYTNWPRDLVENNVKMIYKDPYIDWTIELPCQVKLASEYFGSNDQWDQRWSFQILERNEWRIHTLANGQTCKQKVYKVRQFIKTKWSDYKEQFYDTEQWDKFIDEVQKRLEWVTEPLDTEFKNSNVFRYITVAVTPDNEQWRQKVDVSKDSYDLNNYIKVTWQLGYERVIRSVSDEAITLPGKHKWSCNPWTSPWTMSVWRMVYPRNWSPYCTLSHRYPLSYHRDKLIKIDPVVTTAQWISSARLGWAGWYKSTYNRNYTDTNVSLKTEWNKALILHDICNPGAALCVLWGDAYSRKWIGLEKAVFDYRLPWEFSFISGGWIKLSNKTGESKEAEDKTIYGNNVNFSFEDPTGTREDKIRNPKQYCDYVDSEGKVNPEVDSQWRCKTTYFEDLKTWRKWGVKKIEQLKWTTDLNLSDTENPTNPTTAQDYKATSWQDIVWHVEGNLVIGDHPNKWLNVRGKGTVFVEWDLYINSNMQYVTNSVTDVKEAYKIDSAAFIVKWNIFVAPEVTSTVWVMAAMGPNSGFYSCWDTSKDAQRWFTGWTTSCTSRVPLLIQQLIAREIHFDRLPSNVPLYVKKVKLGEKVTGDNVAQVCSTIWTSDEDKKAHPECFVDQCIQAKNHLEDTNWCFETVHQLTSSECLVNDNRLILSPINALNDSDSWTRIKRIEIAPGESINWSFVNQ